MCHSKFTRQSKTYTQLGSKNCWDQFLHARCESANTIISIGRVLQTSHAITFPSPFFLPLGTIKKLKQEINSMWNYCDIGTREGWNVCQVSTVPLLELSQHLCDGQSPCFLGEEIMAHFLPLVTQPSMWHSWHLDLFELPGHHEHRWATDLILAPILRLRTWDRSSLCSCKLYNGPLQSFSNTFHEG